jgi:hypothetical protein
MTAHPPHCRRCDGCGYIDGPPIWETIDGRPHAYTTVTECRHPWWDDDPDPDLEELARG